MEHKEKNDDKFSIMIRLHNLHHNKMIMFKFFFELIFISIQNAIETLILSAINLDVIKSDKKKNIYISNNPDNKIKRN